MSRSPLRRSWLYVALAALAALFASFVLTACGNNDGQHATNGADGVSTAAVQGQITVFAASSLADAFKEAAQRFEDKNRGTKVLFSFAASSALATQINEGAPADVFASADAAQMQNVTAKGNASDPLIFVTNIAVIVVPKSGSPVAAFADLAKPGVRLVLAGPEVPIGKYARDVLANASNPGGVSPDFSARVLANLKSNEANVRAVLSKVQLGEADAGIVYATDAALATADVAVLAIPAAYNVTAQYPIAITKSAKNLALARAWITFITSAEGQEIMAKYGFGKP